MDHPTSRVLALLEECIAEDDFCVLCNAMDTYWGRNLSTQVLQDTLFRMCACGAENCLRLFLESNRQLSAILNSPDRDGDRAVHKAARNGHLQVMRLLAQHRGVDLSLRNRQGDTALDIVCHYGHKDLIDPLTKHLQQKRLTEDDNFYLYTALIQATDFGSVDTIREMIKMGADINANMDDETGAPLHVVSITGDVTCAGELLDRGADVEILRRSMNQTPLMCAAEYGQVELVQLLLAHGAEVNADTDRCSSALTVACHFGYLEVANALLAAGADPVQKNAWGFTPLYMSTDNPPLLRRILQEPKINVNQACGERDETPLHLAAVLGSYEAVDMLVQAGASVGELTKYGESPLWLAVWKNHVDITQQLIGFNCHLHAHSNGCQVYAWEYNCLEIALGSENFDIADLLYAAGCEPINTVYESSKTVPTRIGSSRSVDAIGNFSTMSLDHRKDSVDVIGSLRLRPEILDLVRANPELIKWVTRRYFSTRTLKNLCCLSIRNSLPRGVDFFYALSQLPLPPTLQHAVQCISDTVEGLE